MKHTYLSILLLLLAVPAAGQNAERMALSMTEDVTKAIVKETSYPSAILYLESGGRHYFALADSMPGPVAMGEISPDICVNDFTTNGKDLVCFCGRLASTNIAVVGWFLAHDFFGACRTYYWTDLPGSDWPYPARDLTRLAERDGNMLAIGIGDAVQNTLAGCVVGIPGLPATTCTCYLGISSEDRERFYDVVETDQYFTTCGVLFGSSPSIRSFDKYQMFLDPAQTFQRSFAYEKGIHVCRWPIGELRMAPLDGNKVAIAGFWEDQTNPSVGGTMIQEIDVDNHLANINVPPSDWLLVQDSGHQSIEDLEYDKRTNRLFLLGHALIGSSIQSVECPVQRPLSTGPLKYFYHSGYELMRLTGRNNTVCRLSVGNDLLSSPYELVLYQYGSGSASCQTSAVTTPFRDFDWCSKEEYPKLNVESRPIIFREETATFTYQTITSICR